MLDLNTTITGFVQLAIQENLLKGIDRIYTTNRLLDLLHLDEYHYSIPERPYNKLANYMDDMVTFARSQEIIGNSNSETEQFEAAIMDLITPYPSELNTLFWEKYAQNPKMATDYFYNLSRKNDYIKTRNIDKNIHFDTKSQYGDLEITINLSKPEKDPKEISKAKTAVSSSYPRCALCMENEGYKGHINHAARQNHRIIRFDLNGELYGLQYSPYVYYNEHSIFLNEKHIPMKVDSKCFNNLLRIVEIFPHYFVGSNADLPIVGGSILAHDHYQGGRHEFPMEKAKAYKELQLKGFPDITVELVNWPMSVIRLRESRIEILVNAAEYILSKWRNYSDSSLNIEAFTNNTPHNTITPIARRKGESFELDLVLRNNRTTEEYPDGLFHPHHDVQHIKKENIGLIEVMGLAILPPRLLGELKCVEDFLVDKAKLTEIAVMHQEWAKHLKKKNSDISPTNVEKILRQAIGDKFTRILEDAGVYKMNDEGRAGILRFIDYLNEG